MSTMEGVDSALQRPGRIDVHIYSPLCEFNSFKNLASNYVGVKEHKLFTQVGEILESGQTMSHAEMGELMLVNRSELSRDGYFGSASSSPMAEDCEADAAWKESLPKEFRKLYGMVRLKSGKKFTSFERGHKIVDR